MPPDLPTPPPRAQQEARYKALRQAFYVVGSLVGVAILTAVIWLAYNNAQVIKEIRSCTTPGGECQKRGEAQTGAAIGTINHITIAANYCSVALALDPNRDALTPLEFHDFMLCVKDHVPIAPQ